MQDELEHNWIKLHLICNHVTKALKEHNISGIYVRKCLKEKHKDPSKVESNSRWSSSPNDGKIVIEKGIYKHNNKLQMQG